MPSRRSARVYGILTLVAAGMGTSSAQAADPPAATPSEHEASPKIGGTLNQATKRYDGSGVDSSFGRIEGDFSVVIGLGATIAPRAPRATADLRLRYLDTAGLFVTYEDASVFDVGSQPKRALSVGAEIRPLFLGRWLTGREIGETWLDLFIDSFGFEVGAAFIQPLGDSFDSRPGVQAGAGLEIPILAHASGPWIGLHGGMRWSDAALGGNEIAGAADRAGYLGITLAWHQFFVAHVVDMGDRAPR